MELNSNPMNRSHACAPCGDGASFSCAYGRTHRALLAILDTIAMVSIFVVRLADALGGKALAIILARIGRAVQATRRPLFSCSMG